VARAPDVPDVTTGTVFRAVVLGRRRKPRRVGQNLPSRIRPGRAARLGTRRGNGAPHRRALREEHAGLPLNGATQRAGVVLVSTPCRGALPRSTGLVADRPAGLRWVVVFILVNECTIVRARHVADGEPVCCTPDVAEERKSARTRECPPYPASTGAAAAGVGRRHGSGYFRRSFSQGGAAGQGARNPITGLIPQPSC
jgi:hypothetical protein